MDTALLWATAIGTCLTALATIALVIVAWSTLRGAGQQLDLLGQDSERQSRPYVSLDVVPGLHGMGAWDLVIQNHGRSLAESVTFTNAPIEPVNDQDHIAEALTTFLAAPMSLPPGSRRRVMWRREPQDDPAGEAGAPASMKVRVGYADDRGNRFRHEFDLSTDLYAAVAPVPTSGPRAPGAEKQLDNIERALRTLNEHVGELRR